MTEQIWAVIELCVDSNTAVSVRTFRSFAAACTCFRACAENNLDEENAGVAVRQRFEIDQAVAEDGGVVGGFLTSVELRKITLYN